MVIIWFTYDIENNKNRKRIRQLAKEYALVPVQKSVFCGEINKQKLEEFKLQCQKLINKHIDSIYFIPLCSKDYEKITELGQPLKKEKNKKMIFL